MPTPVPIILLAAIWAGFTTMFKLSEMLNERRDKILDMERKLRTRHRRRIFWSDWCVFLSLVFFQQVAFICVFIFLPGLLQNSDDRIRFLSGAAAMFFGFCIIFTALSGYKDGRYIFAVLAELEKLDETKDALPVSPSAEQSAPPPPSVVGRGDVTGGS